VRVYRIWPPSCRQVAGQTIFLPLRPGPNGVKRLSSLCPGTHCGLVAGRPGPQSIMPPALLLSELSNLQRWVNEQHQNNRDRNEYICRNTGRRVRKRSDQHGRCDVNRCRSGAGCDPPTQFRKPIFPFTVRHRYSSDCTPAFATIMCRASHWATCLRPLAARVGPRSDRSRFGLLTGLRFSGSASCLSHQQKDRRVSACIISKRLICWREQQAEKDPRGRVQGPGFWNH